MTTQRKMLNGLSESSGSDLFIVDNSDDEWKVLRYLNDWCQLAKSVDIASGYFEIGSLLALDGEWQKVDHIRAVNRFVEIAVDLNAQFTDIVRDKRGRSNHADLRPYG